MTSGRGHRSLPHTADLRLQVWAPTRDECVAEAVIALVASFADVADRAVEWRTTVDLAAGQDRDVLLAALDEAIFALDTEGAVPVTVRIERTTTGQPRLELGLVALGHVRLIGPAPKAATLHDLRFERGSTGWSAEVTIDI